MFPFFFNGANYGNNGGPFWTNQSFMPTFYAQMVPTDFIQHNSEIREQLQKISSSLPSTNEGEALLRFEQTLEKRQQILEDIHSKNKQNINRRKSRPKSVIKADDAEYAPNGPTFPTQACNQRYTRKNIQSNIINQLKSRDLLHHFYSAHKDKVTLFYEYIKILRRGNKRFVTKQYLIDICHFSPGHVGFKTIIRNQKRLELLSIEEFKSGFRFLINYYLLNLSYPAILTSNKMRKQNWVQHFKKCREIRQLIFQAQIDKQPPQQEQAGPYLQFHGKQKKGTCDNQQNCDVDIVAQEVKLEDCSK